MGIAALLLWADRVGEEATGGRADAGHHRVLVARIDRALEAALTACIERAGFRLMGGKVAA